MSWTYFASPLADGDLITRAQRDELYDALLERVSAADLVGVYTIPSDIRSSDLETDLVLYSPGGGGSPSLVRLMAVVRDLSESFVRSVLMAPGSSVASGTTDLFYHADTGSPDAKQVLRLAGATLSISNAEIAELLANPEIASWKRWNLIREALVNLAFVKLPFVASGFGYFSVGPWSDGWANAKTAYLATLSGAVTSVTSTRVDAFYDVSWPGGGAPPGPGPYYQIEGSSWAPEIAIPATSAFASYILYGFRLSVPWDFPATDWYLETQLGSFGRTFIVPSDTGSDMELDTVIATASSVSGTQVVHVKLSAYSDSSALNDVIPSGANPQATSPEIKYEAFIAGINYTVG